MSGISRRRFVQTLSLASAALLAAGSGLYSENSRAAEFRLKFANNLPLNHPMNVRAREAAKRIAEESQGSVALQVFPSSQLGGDTDMLAQARSGAIDFYAGPPVILGTLIPSAQISAVGFAFKDYDQVWAAMDGELGAHIRTEIAKSEVLFAFEKIWDNGFRHITSSTRPIATPADLKGFKIRVPVSPLWTSMFKSLDASPASINFAEVYSALQTKIVEGQENPLAIVQTAKLYEVQKYCSLTGHMWDGFWFLANGKMWAKLPKDLQAIVTKHINGFAMQQRDDVRRLNNSVEAELKGKGLKFNTVDPEAFRAVLKKSGFYAEWKKKYGAEAWAIPEKYTGKLE